jgi:hypothetical protein
MSATEGHEPGGIDAAERVQVQDLRPLMQADLKPLMDLSTRSASG